MMDEGDRAPVIVCEFFGADPDLVASVSCGLIDQMCAHVDVDAALLAAIEVPMLDMVEALARRGQVSAVTVAVDSGRTLVVDFDATGLHLVSVDELLGEYTDVVTSFFDVRIESDTGRIRLRGDLG